MEIKNFMGNPIILGEFPYSVTVQNIPASHSEDGVVCDFFTYPDLPGEERPRIVIVKNPGRTGRITVLSMRYPRQVIYIPNGEIIYDSAEVK